MSDDSRVESLLDELLTSRATPEDVCASCPELLPRVRERWRRMRHVRSELDVLFPPPADSDPGPPENGFDGTALPVVPGYEIEGVLGVGGMGVVFRARHRRLNRVVALKMALAGAYAGARERERFQREAEAVAALRHPNVVQVHDVGDANGRPYFTMEFVEGGSLAQKLAGTPLPARDAAALVATLARAVHAAHLSGIVHRDLKPANILLQVENRNVESPREVENHKVESRKVEDEDGGSDRSDFTTLRLLDFTTSRRDEFRPKISDFGLARRLSGEAGLTRTGTAVGTPSYMAPEQARGATDAVGPPVDIYALGAILYELLTGRPPFRAETAAETVHQLLTQDPVPPSRLNGKVPRDLETICLKCLHKEPRRRYPSAAALADDLDRFLRGDAIAARPEGPLARLVRRIRRRPALSAAVAVCSLLTVVLVGGAAWSISERRAVVVVQAATERAADEDLSEMAGCLQKSSWLEAKAALERAKGRLGARVPDDLRRRLASGERELNLGVLLDAICLHGAESVNGVLDFARTEPEYEAAFRDAGLGPMDESPETIAERIAESNIASALVDALDHWAARTGEHDPPRQRQLLAVARGVAKRRADPDPTRWRDRARDPDVWKNEAAFDKLVGETQFAEQAVPLLLTVAQNQRNLGKNPIPFMKRIQSAHAGDFWANYCLGSMLFRIGEDNRSDKDSYRREAIRYLQAAVALRPEAAVAHAMLGKALFDLDRYDEGIEQQRLAVRYDPSPLTRRRLALVLTVRGPFDEAIDRCRQSLSEFPDDAFLHAAYGTALVSAGRSDDEVVRAFERAVALDPNRADGHMGLYAVFGRQGRTEAAVVEWGKALDSVPPVTEHRFWYGYAEACLYLGKVDDYRHARQGLLKTFGKATDPYIAERTGRACLLLPATEAELLQAQALVDRAAAADRTKYPAGAFPYFLFVKGLLEYRQGRFEQAIGTLRGEAARMSGPVPRLVLAMALHRTGQVAEARKTLALAIAAHDWRTTNVRDQDGHICHILRREAEGMILPRLPDFLKGKYQPQDNDERLAFLGACQYTSRVLAVANLYSDAFVAAPALASDLRAGHRYNAARAAARAGCGFGDALRLTEPERAKWRGRAREWLRADLAALDAALDGNPGANREGVRQKLTQWRAEPDLAGLRDPAELEKLPADERKNCLALWEEVGAVLARAGTGR